MTASGPQSPPAETPVARPAAASAPGSGSFQQKLRLYSGLLLFVYCLSHFSNHALGVISVNAMDQASVWHYRIWRNPAGETALSLAFLIHFALALWKTAGRHTLKMPRWEFLQLVLGLYIPWSLIPHVSVTMGLANNFGFSPTYEQMLTALWPSAAVTQSLLLLVVWTHSVIGLHFWLKLYPLYRRLKFFAFGFAIALPVLSLWGFIEGARRLQLSKSVQLTITPDQFDWLFVLAAQLRAVFIGLVVVSLLVVLFRFLLGLRTRRLAIRFPGELTVKAQPGATLLEITRMNGVPLASVCGGRARCSTCRVKILAGEDTLGGPSAAEAAVLERIGAGDHVRLACQIRPAFDLEVLPLVPVKADNLALGQQQDAYHWGVEKDVVVMFVDLRNFTKITESQLAYDVVHLLNNYLDQTSAAIRAEYGYVDKFIGDGIMAMFGMDTGVNTGSRQALRAAKRIEGVMQALDAERGPQFKDPIRLGIGLHLGSAILGKIGSAGAAGSSGGLTALGDVVNTASRLETANKEHGSILAVSKEVVNAAAATVPEADMAEVKLRGKEKPLQIFALKSLDALVVPTT